MGWNINVEKNTLIVPKENIAHVRSQLIDEEHGHDWMGCFDQVTDQGYIFTSDSAMEHEDSFWNEDLQKILIDAGVTGKICFSSNDGDNSGDRWGYEFKDGKVRLLKGKVSWE